jgi:hypothetical protein
LIGVDTGQGFAVRYFADSQLAQQHRCDDP